LIGVDDMRTDSRITVSVIVHPSQAMESVGVLALYLRKDPIGIRGCER
jgi:hypothetical protein